MTCERILTAMAARNAPPLAIERTEAALRGRPLAVVHLPYLIVSHDPRHDWGPVATDSPEGFDPATYYVLELAGV